MNAWISHFNRTLQESFVDYQEDLLFTDLALFNRKLADWLVFSNAKRPHHALGQQSPLSFLLKRRVMCLLEKRGSARGLQSPSIH
jgi:transposase InsO family protein